jgi:hypothetical protein
MNQKPFTFVILFVGYIRRAVMNDYREIQSDKGGRKKSLIFFSKQLPGEIILHTFASAFTKGEAHNTLREVICRLRKRENEWFLDALRTYNDTPGGPPVSVILT